MDFDPNPEIVESLNSVMDDNKKLCLANGDIITLKPDMRLIYEITSFANCSPAFVSRMGTVAVELETSVDHPHIQRWLGGRPADEAAAISGLM